MNDYSDIIDVEYQKSNRHPQMSLYDRASQFAPFAALTGYAEAINETGRIVDKKLELSAEQKELLRRKLDYINLHLDFEYEITYFIKDGQKNGGKYECVRGQIKKIDDVEKKVILVDKQFIYFEDIIKIESDAFSIFE